MKKRTSRSNSRARPAAVMLAVCHTRARSQPLMLSAPITLPILAYKKNLIMLKELLNSEQKNK